MFNYIPFIHKIKKERKKEELIPLYIEEYPFDPKKKEESEEKNKEDQNIIVIEL